MIATKSEVQCCLDGRLRTGWYCLCGAGKASRRSLLESLGINPDDDAAVAELWEEVIAPRVAKAREAAIAAWADYDKAVADAKAAASAAAYQALWKPRYAKGYQECSRCGGSGNFAHHGECYRCGGNGIDPRVGKKEVAK